jgi:hypothetical protein
MARPLKEGLDYFPLDVDIDQDDKVAMIEAQFGHEGFSVVIRLLMRIYKEGYYYSWSKREQVLFSKRVNVNINTLTEIVNECVNEGLFNRELFEKFEILTSKGIQERYLEAIKRRKQASFIEEYFLIDDIKSIVGSNKIDVTLVNADNKKVNVNINPSNGVHDDNISTQSKGNRKERKKDNNNKELEKDTDTRFLYGKYDNVELSIKEYDELAESFSEEELMSNIERLSKWIHFNNPENVPVHSKLMRKWMNEDRENITAKPRKTSTKKQEPVRSYPNAAAMLTPEDLKDEDEGDEENAEWL